MENRGTLDLEPVQGTWTPTQLREWRRSRGINQMSTAALLGMARRPYQYAERGKTRSGYILITIPRQLELAVKGLDTELGAGHLSDDELRIAYARAVVALEDQAGMIPAYRPQPKQPKRAPKVLPAKI